MLTVITGPMFAGKSEELIRRIKRHTLADLNVVLLRSSIDTRNAQGRIHTHSGITLDMETYSIPKQYSCRNLVKSSTSLVAIDEVQFFDATLVADIERWIGQGIRVVASGLDVDSEGAPFGIMPTLLALAFDVVKLTAVCASCKKEATRTRKKVRVADQITIGGADAYEPLCVRCWVAFNDHSLEQPDGPPRAGAR